MKSLLQQIIVYDNQKLEMTPVSVIERLVLASLMYSVKTSLRTKQILQIIISLSLMAAKSKSAAAIFLYLYSVEFISKTRVFWRCIGHAQAGLVPSMSLRCYGCFLSPDHLQFHPICRKMDDKKILFWPFCVMVIYQLVACWSWNFWENVCNPHQYLSVWEIATFVMKGWLYRRL